MAMGGVLFGVCCSGFGGRDIRFLLLSLRRAGAVDVGRGEEGEGRDPKEADGGWEEASGSGCVVRDGSTGVDVERAEASPKKEKIRVEKSEMH